MKTLTAILENLGLENIRTYIQSGNVVFNYSDQDAFLLPQKVTNEIDKQFGFSPRVIILSLSEFERAVANNPFDRQVSDPQNLHFGFLASKPEQPNLIRMESLKANSEQFYLTDCVFYLYAPMGIGKSKLAMQVEKLIGVPMTDRNFRTVLKLLEIANASAIHTNH
jgi:uncharacterized protein (DUF1697 family)